MVELCSRPEGVCIWVGKLSCRKRHTVPPGRGRPIKTQGNNTRCLPVVMARHQKAKLQPSTGQTDKKQPYNYDPRLQVGQKFIWNTFWRSKHTVYCEPTIAKTEAKILVECLLHFQWSLREEDGPCSISKGHGCVYTAVWQRPNFPQRCGTAHSAPRNFGWAMGKMNDLCNQNTLPNDPLEWIAFMETERKTTLAKSKEYPFTQWTHSSLLHWVL